jgi:hypothetical protein
MGAWQTSNVPILKLEFGFVVRGREIDERRPSPRGISLPASQHTRECAKSAVRYCGTSPRMRPLVRCRIPVQVASQHFNEKRLTYAKADQIYETSSRKYTRHR